MIQIVVPMGGDGRMFAERGYTFPKPLIEINGRPLIEIVVEYLTPSEPHQFVFVCRQEHLQQYALGEVLQLIAPGCHVIPLHKPTAGALCSVLLGSSYFDGDDELLVANADQYLDVAVDRFLAHARGGGWDGSIVTFPNTHPRWSYVRMEGDQVVAVAEKQPISRAATAGLYYFRQGADFVRSAERMLMKNVTRGGEFYVAPVYNEYILSGLRVGTFPVSAAEMHGLGTPEEVERFQARASASH